MKGYDCNKTSALSSEPLRTCLWGSQARSQGKFLAETEKSNIQSELWRELYSRGNRRLVINRVKLGGGGDAYLLVDEIGMRGKKLEISWKTLTRGKRNL